jgi:outer membrane lipoprotein-sorting protein
MPSILEHEVCFVIHLEKDASLYFREEIKDNDPGLKISTRDIVMMEIPIKRKGPCVISPLGRKSAGLVSISRGMTESSARAMTHLSMSLIMIVSFKFTTRIIKGGKIMKRILFLSLLMVALMTSLLVGCAEKDLTQEDLEQLVNDVLVANAEVETVKFNMNTTTTMEVIGGPQPEGATMVGEGTGAIDSANREMYIIMDMDIDVPGKETQTMPMESYFVDGWAHIKVTIEEKGAQWMKMELPDKMWDSQSQINQQIEFLETADEVNYLGTEDVNGEDCYVVEVVPSTEALNKMLSQIQMPDIEGTDLSQLNFANMIKDMAFKQWIAEDGYLIMKSETNVVMEILPEDVGADINEFQKITSDQSSVMVFYDYNEPVSIELPAEIPNK